MKKMLLFCLLCLSVTAVLKGQSVRLFYDNKVKGFILYMANDEIYPVSISLDLQLSNLVFSEGDRKLFVIPPKIQRFKLGELSSQQDNAKYTFTYKFISTMGDVTITDYDNSIVYDLPFQKGKSYALYQGYNGTFSHQNENSLDFTMPEGSEVWAAREGVVVKVVQNNTEACPREECKKYNNYVTIMHTDGTFANYAHIQYNGARCKVGDSVKRGALIAYSGNVGFTSGPHLHFVCFIAGLEKWNTLQTKFKIGNGDEEVFLHEKDTYRRDY